MARKAHDTVNYSFEDFVGDREVFLLHYFDRRPLVRVDALTKSINAFPGIAELDDLLSLKSVPTGYLRVAKNGKGLPIQAYTRTVMTDTGLAQVTDAQKVYELFTSGGTVTWNYLDHLMPSVQRLARLFAEALHRRTEVALFMTPAGHNGFAPHHDSIDVFVVQIEGTKRWKVWDRAPTGRGKEASYAFDDLGEPALELTLSPGDMLYLPHGTPHAAAADGQISVHVSVGVEPQRWQHLLVKMVEELVQDGDFDDSPVLDQDVRAVLADRLRLLAEQVLAADLDADPARLLAGGSGPRGAGPAPGREFERLSQVDGLTSVAVLGRTGLPVEFAPGPAGKTLVLVDNQQLALATPLADALRDLPTGGRISAEDLYPGVPPARSLRAAQGLVRLGLLAPIQTDRSVTP